MGGLSTTPKKAVLSARKEDLYETPPEAVHALLKVEKLPLRIWEPAAGHGAIVKVLQSYGHDVVASDLVDYNEPLQSARWDFLMELKMPEGCEAIITNPPYKLADQFVRHGLELCPTVITLLRLAFLEGRSRSDILDGPLARVHVFRNRLKRMHRDGWAGKRTTSSIAFAWFVFEREHKGVIALDRITWKKGGAP